MENKNIGSPKPDERQFTKHWDLFIGDVIERDNFKEHHLQQLGILCDLYVEYDNVATLIKEEGYTFESDGRHGKQLRPRPEISIRDKILTEIRHFSKILGLILVKDTVITKKTGEKGEWD